MSQKTDPTATLDTTSGTLTDVRNLITLESPIQRGDQTINSVSLRKPAAGELRGIALADLLRLDVSALMTVLPRITSPMLTAQDVAQLDLVDLTAIGTEVLGFFMSKADKANLPASPTM